ncbi:MAG TPA: hypothetical protein VMH39_10620 [Gemmatimonadaceae bacterium]|nr:hypothetical protein [Gemmatimonadaceae bacterium]
MSIAFGVHPGGGALCSRFVGDVTAAELGRYMALLQHSASLRDGMAHFVDCRDAAPATPGLMTDILLGPLGVRFSSVAIVAAGEAAMRTARQVEAVLFGSCDRLAICGTPEEAWVWLGATPGRGRPSISA